MWGVFYSVGRRRAYYSRRAYFSLTLLMYIPTEKSLKKIIVHIFMQDVFYSVGCRRAYYSRRAYFRFQKLFIP